MTSPLGPTFAASSLIDNAEVLHQKLIGLHENGNLPVHQNRVMRKELGIILGISPAVLISSSKSEMWEWARGCIDNFDEYLSQKEEVPEVLTAKLHELFKAKTLPLYRGTVSRRKVEALVGLPNGALVKKNWAKWAWARKTVNDFDEFLRKNGQGTVWEKKVPAIRARLVELHKAHQLPINQKGELNKRAFLAEFGLKSNRSAWIAEERAPLLKELLDEFSEIIRNSEYSQFKYEYLEEALKKILASPDIPLNFGRQVGVKAIAEQLGVIPSALKNTPCLAKLIEHKQKEVDSSLRLGLTKKHFVIGSVSYINIGAKPWSEKHGRIFDFSQFIEPYGQEFAERVGTIFVHLASKWVSPKPHFSRINNFLLWLLKHEGSSSVVNSLREGKRPEQESFERSALTYQQTILTEIHEGTGEGSNQRKNQALTVITMFGDAGVFPHFTFSSQKRNRRKRVKDSNPKPSLVEAQVKGDAESIKRITEEAARYRDIEFDSNKDTIAFVNTLAAERASRNDLPEELAEAIAFLCEERLYELKKESTRVFRKWHETYKTGRELIALEGYSGNDIKSQLDEARGFVRQRAWSDKVAQLFPHNDSKHSLRNLLALVEEEFQGLCPPSTGGEWDQFWRRTYSKVGGAPFAQEHLLPSSAAVSAAVCLYLCESGANCSVGLALEPDSVRKSKLPNHVNVVSTKARSQGKSIYNDLPAKTGNDEIMSCAEALMILKEVTQPLRDKSVIGQSDLLIFASNSSIRSLEEWQLRSNIKGIAEGSNVLSKLSISPSMIRPTVLLHAQLKHPGNLTVANMIAQHKDESTTMGYVAKLPFRMILEERIRKFMDTLQVVIASGVDDGSRKLDIEHGKWTAMVEHSQRTGLGVFCLNPLSGEQPDYPEGQKCKAVERCIDCNKRLVVAHPESIADMIIWQEALEKVQDAWLDDRYQRWEMVWTPWQAFFHVVLKEKMSRGELAVIKAQAVEIVEKRKSLIGFNFPEPW